MGNIESNDNYPSASDAMVATAAYAKISEEATVITQQKEVPHSSINIRPGVIEARYECRDQSTENINYGNDEMSRTTNRDENTSAPIQERYNYKLKNPIETINNIPIDKIVSPVVSPKRTIFGPLQQLLYKLKYPIETINTVPVYKSVSPIVSSKRTIPDLLQQFNHEQIDTTTLLKQKGIEAKHLIKSITNLSTEVTEGTAAVYHYLETKSMEDEMTSSDRARKVMGHIKTELRTGNSKPAYQFLEMAKAVLPVLQEEVGINLEANLFSSDDDDDNNDDNDNDNDRDGDGDGDGDGDNSHSPLLKQQRSISEQTAAIFQFLDGLGNDDTQSIKRDPVSLYENLCNEISQFNFTGESTSNIFQILEENEEILTTMEQPREHRPDLSADDMDLEFVEYFDLAYSEFLFYHPKLVAKNPNLMKNLRIFKLQKLLEYNEIIEMNLTAKLDLMNENKRDTEEYMHYLLKEAIRKKAARQTYLQSEVNDIHWSTKKAQAQLRWKLVKYSEDRAKRQSKLREQFKSIPHVKTRQELIPLIPEGHTGKKLKNTIKASFIAEGSLKPDMLSFKQEEQLREIEVENTAVNVEIAMLNQKLTRLRIESNKLNWVPSILARLDEGTMYKLKEEFEKKEGVVL